MLPWQQRGKSWMRKSVDALVVVLPCRSLGLSLLYIPTNDVPAPRDQLSLHPSYFLEHVISLTEEEGEWTGGQTFHQPDGASTDGGPRIPTWRVGLAESVTELRTLCRWLVRGRHWAQWSYTTQPFSKSTSRYSSIASTRLTSLFGFKYSSGSTSGVLQRNFILTLAT